MNKFKTLLILAVLITAQSVKGQSTTSPYSILGVGDLSFDGLIQNQALGELGISVSSPWHINHRNPSLLYRNVFSTFQFGLEVENRTFATDTLSEKNVTGGLRYLSVSLPIIKGTWSTNFGILPFSTVNYNISSTQEVTGSTAIARTNLRGEGGLSQVFLNNGIKIYRNIGIGASIRYIFGSIVNTNNVNLQDASVASNFRSTFIESTNYNNLSITGAFSWRQRHSKNRFVNYGLTYEFPVALNGVREESTERRSLFNAVLQDGDETEVTTRDVVFQIPAALNLGVSFEKLNKLTVGVDLSIRDWSNSSGFENGFEEFRRTIKIAVGGELIPSYNDVNSYIKRISFRSGFSYEQLPFLINGQEINDFGISFGASLPLGGISSLDTAFKIGQRGSTEGNLIRETYYRIVFGVTINDRSWFVRRKYN